MMILLTNALLIQPRDLDKTTTTRTTRPHLTHKEEESTRTNKETESHNGTFLGMDDGNSESRDGIPKEDFREAIQFGLEAMRELLEEKEPKWYQMGLYLDGNEPAAHVAAFGAPSKRASKLSHLGFAAIEASRKISESLPEDPSRQNSGFPFDTHLLRQECPLRGVPRCLVASRRYRTADGTCNNPQKPWRGSALLPMQRFLAPVYDDGIQQVRRSVFGGKLPSARTISTQIHRDRDQELPSITLMFMQWGQFVDHDLTSTVKSRSFNGSIPRCCIRGGLSQLAPDLLHPNCLPIEVPSDDWFFSRFGIRCLEFTRSAPSTRIDCDLGWREQINQVTSFLDGSVLYGSEVETSDSMRTFRSGKLHYGRPQGREPLQPPDPPGGELCRSGALTSDCLQGGDGRFSEQPGLTALHTIFIRYHNRIAEILGQLNRHWSDEKVYQETRRIIAALIQHITYREFLPIVLGEEVMELFKLNLERKTFYSGYDERVNPSIANSFSAAAFRFGHSLVQNSYVRYDTKHRPLFNNVTLHEEQDNIENIWSFGSLDRILLGFCNQPSQKRDEFISDELTNHLFQSRETPFGMDLAAINIQRGRDHGLPGYTSWREPCGLNPVKNWLDLQKIIHPETVHRLKLLYEHVDDIDLFTGGLAEKPVRGGIIGPTFACIIAQQFLNLRKGDRFWYENGNFQSSFTPAQLQQIRHVTLAQLLCQTLTEIETLQPFVFLTSDQNNQRLRCDSRTLNRFDLSAWIERDLNEVDSKLDFKRSARKKKKKTRLRIPVQNVTMTRVPLQNKQNYNTNTYVVVNDIPQRPIYDDYTQRPTYNDYTKRPTRPSDDVTYLVGYVMGQTTPVPPPQTPISVNIQIQYYPAAISTTTKKPRRATKKRTTARTTTTTTTQRPYYNIYSDDFNVVRPQQTHYGDEPFSTSKRPYIYRPSFDPYERPDRHDSNQFYYQDLPKPLQTYATSYVEKMTKRPFDYSINDKLDFDANRQYVKISSVRGQGYVQHTDHVEFHVAQREGALDLGEDAPTGDVRLVDIEVVPGENRWVLFNATEENVAPPLHIPDLTNDLTCTNELPRPMNMTVPVPE